MNAVATSVPPVEPGRARYPDRHGTIDRDGVHIYWEHYGEGPPAILLMPTWSIAHSRHWKGQIAYLARHFGVATFDGRGNGRSDRPVGPAAYADTEFVKDAIAVMDATNAERVVAAGLSMGAGYAIRLAAEHPERVSGLVLIGSALALMDGSPVEPRDDGDDGDGDERHDSFEDPLPDDDGWSKYNAHYWRRDWPGFAAWFAGDVIYSEPHSTKQIEDMVGWILQTDPATIIDTERAPFMEPPAHWRSPAPWADRATAFIDRVACPALVIHGTDDRIMPIRYARRVAALLGGSLLEVDGGGHAAQGRDPVRTNLAISDFVRAQVRTTP